MMFGFPLQLPADSMDADIEVHPNTRHARATNVMRPHTSPTAGLRVRGADHVEMHDTTPVLIA